MFIPVLDRIRYLGLINENRQIIVIYAALLAVNV